MSAFLQGEAKTDGGPVWQNTCYHAFQLPRILVPQDVSLRNETYQKNIWYILGRIR